MPTSSYPWIFFWRNTSRICWVCPWRGQRPCPQDAGRSPAESAECRHAFGLEWMEWKMAKSDNKCLLILFLKITQNSKIGVTGYACLGNAAKVENMPTTLEQLLDMIFVCKVSSTCLEYTYYRHLLHFVFGTEHVASPSPQTAWGQQIMYCRLHCFATNTTGACWEEACVSPLTLFCQEKLEHYLGRGVPYLSNGVCLGFKIWWGVRLS